MNHETFAGACILIDIRLALNYCKHRKMDIVVGERDPTYFTVLRNVNGTFPGQLTFPVGGSAFAGMTGVELNGDGKPDVIVNMQFSAQTSVILNSLQW